MRYVPEEAEDISVLRSEGHGQLHDPSDDEVLTMVLGDDEDDVMFGRMPVGAGEITDFEQMSTHRIYDTANASEGAGGDELDLLSGDDDAPEAFTAPVEHFPRFKAALRKFQSAEPKGRVVRIDTDETYGDFVCEKAVKELSRRVDELRAAFEAHAEDGHGSPSSMRKWDDIMGAAQAVSDLRDASSADEAAAALPQVPLDLPAFAEGKVKCWRDGNDVVCSLRFAAADGGIRVATMVSRPRIDTDEVSGWAQRAGVSPAFVVGVAPELAAVACGKKLVRDVAGAALRAHRRLDVCGMDEEGAEPVLLARPDDSSAPLAALMAVEQAAGAGDSQAAREMALIRRSARSPLGQKIAGPMLAESSRRLAAGQAHKAKSKSWLGRLFA